MKKYNIVLREKPLDEGLTINEVTEMFSLLSGTKAIPIKIQGRAAIAMGFINLTDAEFMDYDYKHLEGFVTNILNDMGDETPDEYEIENQYGYSTLKILRE